LAGKRDYHFRSKRKKPPLVNSLSRNQISEEAQKKPLLKEEVQYLELIHLSSSRSYSAGIGTWVSITWLPRLHRAGPSASLDKSVLVYLIGRFISCVSRVVKCQYLTVLFLCYKIDYLVTLNRKHFIDDPDMAQQSGLRIGTPGEALNWVRGQISAED
jgi:hypothetical protein